MSIELIVDNQVAIVIFDNLNFHGRTKRLNIKLFFLRDVQRNGVVCLKYCKTEDHLADIFTKALVRSRFQFLREKFGILT